jgi:hypothetical protein
MTSQQSKINFHSQTNQKYLLMRFITFAKFLRTETALNFHRSQFSHKVNFLSFKPLVVTRIFLRQTVSHLGQISKEVFNQTY